MTRVRRDLPSGTVTFLFTDIEGSTKLLHRLGSESYAEALAVHRRLLREAFGRHGGIEVDTQGDAFFYAFPTAAGAVEAAREGQAALASGPIRVRIGIHTGVPRVTREGYVGPDVHKGARLAAAGHGDQVLLSKETRELVSVEATDLGEHRVKDFAEPVSIFQVGSERFPPLKTISNTNLPRPASSFVGRGREVREVVSLLKDGARLLTLTGPGGSGKTRLAIEAAAELVPEFKAGVFWVGLAPLRDPALVAETIGQTLGAKDGLADHIAQRELLLLLDNLEQVVDAAPELASLVETCPNLRLIVTSRELLRVKGEVDYPVLPLADSDAMELFCGRSRTEPNETVHALCRALDNLPLALELAAARTSALSPRQILERLSQRLDLLKGGRDADPRQQTLRATIEWSHDLLTEPERRLFARLSIFVGGCTLAAAEDVADADVDALQALAEKSLIRHTNERFWMLETIRDYAAEQLDASGEAEELRDRHADHFLALAEAAEPYADHHPDEWLLRLEPEHDNFRAALDWLETESHLQRALRFAGALRAFWENHVAEGRQRLENLLHGDQSATESRAMALAGAALLAHHAGDLARATLRGEEAVALYRELGDVRGYAVAGLILGLAITDQGLFSRARQLFDESALLLREVGDEDYALWAANLLGGMYQKLGDRERAREVHDRNLSRARALGNRAVEAQALASLASLAVDEGRPREAVSMMKDVLLIDRDLSATLSIAFDLIRFACALAPSGGDPSDAMRLLACAEALRDEAGDGPLPPWLATLRQEVFGVIRGELDDEAFNEAWKRGQTLTADEAIALALDSTPGS
jgi:predicted ATPase/class 3 adenylate cyclase